MWNSVSPLDIFEKNKEQNHSIMMVFFSQDISHVQSNKNEGFIKLNMAYILYYHVFVCMEKI